MLKLSDVVNAFMKIEEDVDVYLNKRNGTVVTISSKADSNFYEDRAKNFYTDLANNNDDYILLPNCKSLGAEKIMDNFIDTIELEDIKNDFTEQLSCNKSCAKFMDMIYRYGLIDYFTDFKHTQMIDVAKETVKYYNIEYVDDIAGPDMEFTIEVTRTIKKEFVVKGKSVIDALDKLKMILYDTSLNDYEVVSEEKIIK